MLVFGFQGWLDHLLERKLSWNCGSSHRGCERVGLRDRLLEEGESSVYCRWLSSCCSIVFHLTFLYMVKVLGKGLSPVELGRTLHRYFNAIISRIRVTHRCIHFKVLTALGTTIQLLAFHFFFPFGNEQLLQPYLHDVHQPCFLCQMRRPSIGVAILSCFFLFFSLRLLSLCLTKQHCLFIQLPL